MFSLAKPCVHKIKVLFVTVRYILSLKTVSKISALSIYYSYFTLFVFFCVRTSGSEKNAIFTHYDMDFCTQSLLKRYWQQKLLFIDIVFRNFYIVYYFVFSICRGFMREMCCKVSVIASLHRS